MSIPEIFQGKNFYEVLNIQPNATSKEISQAYRRMALKFHPDHNLSPTANEEFSFISKIHESLSNPDARALYDETGQTEPSQLDSENGEFDTSAAYDYWRSIFPKISQRDIEEFEKRYINSEEELEDIENAYELGNGDLTTIFEHVPFANLENLDRILNILHQEFGAQYTSTEINRFKRKMQKFEQREAKEAEELKRQLLTPAERLMLEGSSQRASASSSSNPDEGLFALIQARQSTRQQSNKNWLDQLEEKYTKNTKSKRR